MRSDEVIRVSSIERPARRNNIEKPSKRNGIPVTKTSIRGIVWIFSGTNSPEHLCGGEASQDNLLGRVI